MDEKQLLAMLSGLQMAIVVLALNRHVMRDTALKAQFNRAADEMKDDGVASGIVRIIANAIPDND